MLIQNLFKLDSLSFMNLGCKSEEREVDGMMVPSSHDKQLKCYPDNDCLEKLTPRLGIWALLGASAHTLTSI